LESFDSGVSRFLGLRSSPVTHCAPNSKANGSIWEVLSTGVSVLDDANSCGGFLGINPRISACKAMSKKKIGGN